MSTMNFDIEPVKTDFSKIIKLKGNNRILFSGKFGLGKTYFLNHVFNEFNEEYFSIHLFPVNYQIQDFNKDIVELIKYDILFELIKVNPDAFKEDKNAKTIISAFINNFDASAFVKKSLVELVGIVPFVGNILGKPFIESFNFEKIFKNFNSEKDIDIEAFMDDIKSKSLKESDLISSIINIKINELKGSKESILIIDDFDRMEPKHIFRVFNILSSFFDKNDENIFGFDKIIIVADYDNLKSIFHHLYGKATDFSGYIDKFFSIEPYFFNNSDSIIQSVDSIFNYSKNDLEKLNEAYSDNGYIRLYIIYFLSKSIENGLYNMREILKITKSELNSLSAEDFYPRWSHDQNLLFVIMLDISIKVLISIFSSKENLLEIINKLIDKPKFKGSKDFSNIFKLNDIMIKVLGYKCSKAESSQDKNFVIERLNNKKEMVFEEKGEKMYLTLLRDYVALDMYNHTYYDYGGMSELFSQKKN